MRKMGGETTLKSHLKKSVFAELLFHNRYQIENVFRMNEYAFLKAAEIPKVCL